MFQEDNTVVKKSVKYSSRVQLQNTSRGMNMRR